MVQLYGREQLEVNAWLHYSGGKITQASRYCVLPIPWLACQLFPLLGDLREMCVCAHACETVRQHCL